VMTTVTYIYTTPHQVGFVDRGTSESEDSLLTLNETKTTLECTNTWPSFGNICHLSLKNKSIPNFMVQDYHDKSQHTYASRYFLVCGKTPTPSSQLHFSDIIPDDGTQSDPKP
jgi:hypothetical protein